MPETDAKTTPAAIEAWVRDVLPEIVGSYDYAVAGKDQGLPDVVVELERTAVVINDLRFPFSALQELWLRVFDCVASIMVDNSDPAAAALDLRDFADRLAAQAITDTTLGGRVFMVSPQIEADFLPQFVAYPDGTQGRQVQVRLSVGQPTEVVE